MDAQGYLPFYTGIIQGEIDVNLPLLGVTQNNPMSVSNSPPEVEINTTNKPRRSTNFSVEEDNIFVSAWLNTSIDVVHGNEQKQETFHKKIWQYFCQHNLSDTTRIVVSLSSRWGMINRETSRFCGFIATLEATPYSGTIEHDTIINYIAIVSK